MYLYCDKKNGKVIMYSEDKISAPNFDEKKVTITKVNKEKLKKNEYDLFIKDNKAVFKLNEQGEYNKNKK